MRHSNLIIFVVLATIALIAEFGHACVCMAPHTVEEALAKSSAVFSGRVISIYRPLLDRMGITKNGGHRVKFEITKRWKGSKSRTVVVTTRLTGEACGYPFEKGNKYLVYVVDEPIQTGICTGTKDFDDAENDMSQLNKLLQNNPEEFK